jgi:hypothetical protein
MDKVKTGDPLELSASFINETIEMNAAARRHDLTSITSRLNNFGIITIRNDSDKDRKTFEPINVGKLIIDIEKEGSIKPHGVFSGILDDKIDMFAICLTNIPKTKTGRVMLMGITPVKVKVESADHNFVKVKEDKLVSCVSGPARLLGAQEDSGDTWGMIYLGGTGNAGNNYTGFFRLEPDEDNDNSIKVVDGTDTLGSNCGIYISGIDKTTVPGKTLSISAESYIVLEATYADETWTIEIKTETSFPEFTADKFTALLGIVKWDEDNNQMGAIVQIWNNGIIYNNRYS